MSSTIDQTKEAILKRGDKASKHQITRELRISSDYADLILGELKRKGEIVFTDGFYALTSSQKDVSPDKERKKPVRRPPKPKKTKKVKDKKESSHLLVGALGISEPLARTLENAGYGTVESIADAPISKLMVAAKLELQTAAQLINQARKTKR